MPVMTILSGSFDRETYAEESMGEVDMLAHLHAKAVFTTGPNQNNEIRVQLVKESDMRWVVEISTPFGRLAVTPKSSNAIEVSTERFS